jgi:Amt family ammonium transporter
VAGLVAITPCAGFVTPMGAMVIGLVVSVACYAAIMMKAKLGYDDSLDVFGVHGVGGMFGALAVGLFAKAGITGDVNGLFYGNPKLVATQALSVVAAFAYSFVATFILLKVVDALLGLRVSTEEEEVGLDLTQHGERGYIMGLGELMGLHHEPSPLASSLAQGRIADISSPVDDPVSV